MTYISFFIVLSVTSTWAQQEACFDVGCTSDYKGQCFKENQPDMECEMSDILCRPSGQAGGNDQCEWTNWIDNDNPSGNCDCENSLYFDATSNQWVPVGPGTTCDYSQYRIRLKGQTTEYSDVNAITSWVVRDNMPGIGCFNADQTPNACPTWNPNNPRCCPDFEVKYCCKPQQAQMCYCCRNKCNDNGCSKLFGGKGECVNATRTSWDKIEAGFDLRYSSPGANRRCTPSDPKYDKDCCLCLKKKPCMDNGCMEQGGMCVDMKNVYLRGNMFPMNNLDLAQNLGDDLCRKDQKFTDKSCCRCYKKKDD